ncbi:MAG: hypothetical protein CSB06_00300 [Bacteroidia bacterium]|nr:MAG: hypothetical protein CSB06_00300 [Bacteroidia bacterium]
MKKLRIRVIFHMGFVLILSLMLVLGMQEFDTLRLQSKVFNRLNDLHSKGEIAEFLRNTILSDYQLFKSMGGVEEAVTHDVFIKEHESNSLLLRNFAKEFETVSREAEDNLGNPEAQEIYALYVEEISPLFQAGGDQETGRLTFDNLLRMVHALKNKINQEEDIIKKRMEARTQNFGSIFVLLFVATIFLLLIGYFLFTRRMIIPLKEIHTVLLQLVRGEHPKSLPRNENPEMQAIIETVDELGNNMEDYYKFSSAMIQGNWEASFQAKSRQDKLGNALLQLRKDLQDSHKQDEIRNLEDARRNRINEAVNLFAEILRKHPDNIHALADEIISSLVKFMEANQGAFFLRYEDEQKEEYYELIGAYAYNRKKYLSKKIKPGEGLVGAVALEKYTVHMTEVPDDFVEIESGTGGANPSSIIIVPLKTEDDVIGIIELASFKVFEKYEVEIVERIAENIAGSLSGLRIGMKTSALIKENKEQTALLAEQSEEIRRLNEQVRQLRTEKNSSQKPPMKIFKQK